MSQETLLTSAEDPKNKSALLDKYKEEKKEEREPLNPENINDSVSELPEPVGYRLLVLPFTPKEKN